MRKKEWHKTSELVLKIGKAGIHESAELGQRSGKQERRKKRISTGTPMHAIVHADNVFASAIFSIYN